MISWLQYFFRFYGFAPKGIPFLRWQEPELSTYPVCWMSANVPNQLSSAPNQLSSPPNQLSSPPNQLYSPPNQLSFRALGDLTRNRRPMKFLGDLHELNKVFAYKTAVISYISSYLIITINLILGGQNCVIHQPSLFLFTICGSGILILYWMIRVC
jgi:hypothetical protein